MSDAWNLCRTINAWAFSSGLQMKKVGGSRPFHRLMGAAVSSVRMTAVQSVYIVAR